MDNINNSEIKLSLQEEEIFISLTSKIINQQSQTEILTDSEKKQFYQILQKLKLLPQSQTARKDNSNILNLIVGSISFLAFYLLLVGIPIAIVVTITKSSSLIIFIIISATFSSIVGIGAFMGKVSWGWTFSMIVFFVIIGILLSIFLN